MRLKPGTPLTVSLRWSAAESLAVGRLAALRGTATLEFAPEFGATGVQIDPLRYPAGPGLHPARTRHFGGLHGVFADSLPDGWGRLVLHRRLARAGIRIDDLDPVDLLALVGAGGRGALVYEPAIAPDDGGDGGFDLDQLAAGAAAVLEGSESDLIEILARLGGSSGGARPKVHVGFDGTGRIVCGEGDLPGEAEPWIVKFRATEDPEDIGPIEMVYAEMATAAGLEMAECRLIPAERGAGYFATRRFDRVPGGGRLHMLSLCAALEAPYGVTAASYDTFLRATLALTRSAADVAMAFRRMVFNVLAHNRDDHTRQHSYLMDRQGRWRLAPAYDLTFSRGPGGEHYLDVEGEARQPTVEHMLALGRRHGLKDRQMASILDEVRGGVARWSGLAGVYGVGRDMRTEIQRVLSR
ncbi:type II toxin-antitoxin system HipA family toxin [Rhodospirillum centenum]|uniref:Uncharacterized protein n=1 Tax=Rhodospirillum centenum (strain ATCC 51521 / SW) TaxID=414684 RepID=B6IRP9_RHOCS|nr:type II toxin-antitoxin system HipA family toxin [Rhodospirillum centenum]ACI98135.1 conserved hypothetical protein [Rhodospirillum centenum SW]